MKNTVFFPLVLAAALPAGAEEIKFPNIAARPAPADFSFLQSGVSTASFSFNEDSRDGFQMNFRSCDLTAFDLSASTSMSHASFNSGTKFPARLPPGFDPAREMELGRNPGLGVRKLHARGIDGRGVGVAIIDQALLTTHAEYADRLKFYEEIHCLDADTASMHAPAVASLSVGKTIGVAPGASLYAIGEINGDYGPDDKFVFNLDYVAQSIDRLVEVNRQLPASEKIRVISISLAMVDKWKGYDRVMESIRKARAENIFVLTVQDPAFPMDGMGRRPDLDPDDKKSYTGGTMFCGNKEGSDDRTLQVPMDSRTLADPTGDNSYYFSRIGGQSWLEPWMAGLYALACQVYPQVTPELFWSVGLETADAVKFSKGGKKYTLRKVVNPVKLIARLEKLAGK
mgnify:CR=1 FL=1